MAVAAGDNAVPACERERRFGMVKLFRIFDLVEPRFGMALEAILPEFALVRVIMTRNAT